MKTEYIVVTSRVIGSQELGFDIAYDSDFKKFSDKPTCIQYGLEECESDDFLIGVLRDGYLEEIWWMNEQHPPEDAQEIAEALHLAAPAEQEGAE